MHSSETKKERGMIIKLDMVNAFDRVNHQFLFQVMEKFGIGAKFISWIKACNGHPWIDPVVNGRLRNRIRSIPPSCPVGNESDTIRVRHEADSTFGQILNRDTTSQRIRHVFSTCPENRTRTPQNRTRNPRKETVRFT